MYFPHTIRIYHAAAILSAETKIALFHYPKPRRYKNESKAWGDETKLFSLHEQYGHHVIKMNLEEKTAKYVCNRCTD